MSYKALDNFRLFSRNQSYKQKYMLGHINNLNQEGKKREYYNQVTCFP